MQTFLIRQQTVNITAAGIYMVQAHAVLTQSRQKAHCIQCTAFPPQRSTALSTVHLESSECAQPMCIECAQPMCMHLQPCRPCICLTCVTAAGVPSSSPEQPYIAQCTTDCHLKPTEKFQSQLTGGLFVGRFG